MNQFFYFLFLFLKIDLDFLNTGFIFFYRTLFTYNFHYFNFKEKLWKLQHILYNFRYVHMVICETKLFHLFSLRFSQNRFGTHEFYLIHKRIHTSVYFNFSFKFSLEKTKKKNNQNSHEKDTKWHTFISSLSWEQSKKILDEKYKWKIEENFAY